jgi:predicted sulfurtransferase
VKSGEMAKKKSKSNQQASMTPFVFLIIGVILILVAAVVLTQPRDNSNNVLNQDNIVRVTPDETRAAVRDSGAVILDVRSQTAYNTSHAEGAINIPLEDLPGRMNELDPQQWIITYCT